MTSSLDPAAFLAGSLAKDESRTLIVLNQALHPRLFSAAWSYSSFRVCADGGANRLYDFFDSDSERRKFVPDVITGDFDSLRDDVKDYYAQLGAGIVHDPDQYSTDLMKATRIARGQFGKESTQRHEIIILGGMGGRVDHQFHSIHHLFKTQESLEYAHEATYLVSDQSITMLLMAGTHKIKTPRSLVGDTCGIIPISGPTHITTHGLRWDITDWETSFGTQVSTSNVVEAEEVEVQNADPVIFTVEIRGMDD